MLFSLGIGQIWLMAALMAGAGALSGVLAGLFGIGGGAVLVPILVEFLGFMGVEQAVRVQVAIGTSLAIIVPTSIRSFLAHQKRGAPDTALLKSWRLVVPVGVLAASFVVAFVSGGVLKLVFALVALAIAGKMLFGGAAWQVAPDLPRQPWRGGSGFVIGFVSTFMGIGGGNLNNVLMTSCGRSIHQAVATSAGLGVLIAVPGCVAYIVLGWGNPALPPFSLGYVNLLAVVVVAPLTMAVAPMGVRIAHSLSKRRMEILYGAFLTLVAVRFVSTAMTA